jgi:hypothetical protein
MPSTYGDRLRAKTGATCVSRILIFGLSRARGRANIVVTTGGIRRESWYSLQIAFEGPGSHFLAGIDIMRTASDAAFHL